MFKIKGIPAVSEFMSKRKVPILIVVTFLVIVVCYENWNQISSLFSPKSKIKYIPDAIIQIGNETIEVEIADTEKTRATGLMYRKYLPKNHGMLFVYKDPTFLTFWMKNTLISLSIAFINEEGIIINIEEMDSYAGQPDDMLTRYYSKEPALYALEMPQGWFTEKSIIPGMKMQFLSKK